jgi:hypothetical protein
VPVFRLLFARLSQGRPGFIQMLGLVRFVVGSEASEQVFIRVLRFFVSVSLRSYILSVAKVI